MALVLSRAVRESRDADNCLLFDLPDGSLIRLWLTPKAHGARGVRCVIDAPRTVHVRRGELCPAAAVEPPPTGD